MKASLDTNIIIHFYRANCQDILFNFFKEGVVIYEQIRNIELNNHGQDILGFVDADITSGRIQLFTDQDLLTLGVLSIFRTNVAENKLLYSPGDLGEVYAISLAQTLGACALVTDDTKQGGPYMSLLQFEDEVMPFNFSDVLILRYLFEGTDEIQTVEDFNTINTTSSLNWSFSAQLKKFIKRFCKASYRNEDKEWIECLIFQKQINIKEKFILLSKEIKKLDNSTL